MKRSKSENKGQRRRSWFNGASSIFHLFSSAPNSPMNEYNKQLTQADVYQQNDTTDTCQPKSTSNRLSSIISKATKKHRRKFSTVTQDTDITANSKNPQYNTSSTLLDDPCLGSSSCSMRRNSSKSEATTLSDNCIDHPNQSHIIKNTQLVTSDEEEIDRIQLKNDLVKLAFEGEFSLPFDYRDLPNARILDVGCGPGSWCIDLAQKYPKIQVVGVDHLDIFPSEHNIPSNCQLLVADALNGLREFPESSFDVVHLRFMALAFTVSQYLKVIKDCWRLLKPGGYIEILESDIKVYSAGPVTAKANEEISKVTQSRNYCPEELIQLIPAMISLTGLNTQIKYRSIPMGIWGGRIGVLCKEDMINLINRFQYAINEYYHKSKEEVARYENNMSVIAKEIEQYHSYTNYYFYTSQKPPNMEVNRGLTNSIVTSLPNHLPTTFNTPMNSPAI